MRQIPAFQHVQWNPDRAELRRFAVSMAAGFLLLGLLAAWRRHHLGTATWVLWTLGALLAAGALTPGAGRAFYLAVYLPTSLVGYAVSHVLLTAIFFGVVTPLALLLRLLGKDPLHLRPGATWSHWTEHSPPRGKEGYYRQF
jgi:hypothetical protein